MRILYVLSLLLLVCVDTFAQGENISGTIIDATTKLPLAFVGVTIKETKKGMLTDIDGHFAFRNITSGSTLIINYIGYEKKELPISKSISPLVITLKRNVASLDEVVVTSDINPAHRIIRLAQQHKKDNDPQRYSSFAYNAYTIAAAGAGEYFLSMANKINGNKAPNKDTLIFKTQKDSLEYQKILFFEKSLRENYFFITESYTQRIFKYPKLSKETVLATKVTGISNPVFAMTSSNFQPFGFYEDYLIMTNQPYLSPLIAGSINMYKFNLRLVVPHENDTTYVVSYEPLKGKNFSGLKGVLYINSDGYAIENVIASPADEKSMIISFRLQQKYEKLQGHWFPVQLNTHLQQKLINTDSVLFYWDTRTYINHIVIDTPINRAAFSAIQLEFQPRAGDQTDSAWQALRPDTLKAKEKITYQAYDSLPKDILNVFDKMNKIAAALAISAIPWGKVDIPFKYLFSGANDYEKFRLGAGIQTNTGLSKWFSTGGYIGYGFGDKAWKWGANLEFIFNDRTRTKLRFDFSQDLQEPGSIPFFNENSSVFSRRSIRNLYSSRMDSIRQWKATFSTRPWPALQTDAWLLREERNPAAYTYNYDPASNNTGFRHFANTEAGIALRFTLNEAYARLGRSQVQLLPPRTQLMLHASIGLKGFANGELDYKRVALQLNHFIRNRQLGETSLLVDLGQVWGDVPYAYLFNARGSISPGSRRGSAVYIPNTFQTVGLYEFTASKTASLFIEHNFGNLLLKPKNIHVRPELVLVQNISYGSLPNAAAHKGLNLQAPEKGLFETGLLLNNLYRINLKLFYLGFGIGYFQRYGQYALPDKKDNRAIKFGVTGSF